MRCLGSESRCQLKNRSSNSVFDGASSYSTEGRSIGACVVFKPEGSADLLADSGLPDDSGMTDLVEAGDRPGSFVSSQSECAKTSAIDITNLNH